VTLLAFVLIVVAVVAMVWLLRREVNRAVSRLEADIRARQEALDGQQQVLYKQGKAQAKRAAAVIAASDRAVGRANTLIAKNRDLSLDVQQILLAPKIQAVLNEEVDGGR
jgi:hypothetical protein